jgi:hypothetical protein
VLAAPARDLDHHPWEGGDPVENPSETSNRLDIGGDTSVETDGSTVEFAGTAVPVMVLRLPAARAHRLAHSLLGDRLPDLEPTDRTLARGLEAVAAAAGDLGALRCAAEDMPGVGQQQRMKAAGILRDREPRLSPVQRLAVVDAAARWMEEDAGDELAFALLRASCSSDVVASQVYVELLSPTSGPEQ